MRFAISSRDVVVTCAIMQHERPMTEVWFRSFLPYLKQCQELDVRNYVLDRGHALKRNRRALANIPAWANMTLGLEKPWRVLELDQYKAVATLWETGQREPSAFYPIWNGREQELNTLEKMIKKPFFNNSLVQEAAEGQSRVIVVSHLLPIKAGDLDPGAHQYETISEMQEAYPEVTLLINGSYSWSKMFGLNFKAVSIDCSRARIGMIYLPNGKRVDLGSDRYSPGLNYWYNLLGYTYAELTDSAHNRTMYTIKSALWAGKYYKSVEKFRIRRGVSNMDPRVEDFIKTNSLVFTKKLTALPGDKVVCDDCSLWLSCKLFREGAICAVPQGPMKDVNKLFKTRDANSIVKALSAITAASAERAEAALEREAESVNSGESPGADPALTKLLESTFKMGDRLLQIVDPSQRAGKQAVNVNVAGGAQRVEISTSQPQAQVAHIYQMLEQQGYTREQITPELVQQVFENMMQPQPEIARGKVIQGQVAP